MPSDSTAALNVRRYVPCPIFEIAQWLSVGLQKPKVAGSTPAFEYTIPPGQAGESAPAPNGIWPNLVKALALGASDCTFESCYPDVQDGQPSRGGKQWQSILNNVTGVSLRS